MSFTVPSADKKIDGSGPMAGPRARLRRGPPLRCAFGSALLVLSLCSAKPSLAADAPGRAVSAADRAAAQVLFDQGRELMERGRPEEACPRFEESERLESGLGTQFNLADCYEAVGRVASAYTLFLEVAARAKAAGQTRREQVARERAAAVEAKLPTLVISVAPGQPGDVQIERDGSLVGSPQLGLAVPIDPGKHQVRAFGPGVVPWTMEVDVPKAPGVHTVNVPRLEPLSQDSWFSLSGSPTKTAGLAALGVSAVAIGVGTGFAIHAHSRNQDSKEAGCSGQGCPTPESLALRRSALTAGDRATWAIGIGGVGLAAAAVLLWVWPDPERVAGEDMAWRLIPSLGVNEGALGVEAAF